MSDLVLGRVPALLTVNLTAGATFVARIRSTDGSAWPDGTVVELRFDGDIAWPATVVDDSLSWEQSAADVDALIALTPKHVSLWDVVDPVAQMWARGTVSIS